MPFYGLRFHYAVPLEKRELYPNMATPPRTKPSMNATKAAIKIRASQSAKKLTRHFRAGNEWEYFINYLNLSVTLYNDVPLSLTNVLHLFINAWRSLWLFSLHTDTRQSHIKYLNRNHRGKIKWLSLTSIKKSYLNGIYKNYNYLQCLIESVYYLNYKVCARKKKKKIDIFQQILWLKVT